MVRLIETAGEMDLHVVTCFWASGVWFYVV